MSFLDNDLNRQKERHGSEYKKLVGHSGPVYGLSFSPDNKYLVSCSEDKTARLWSTQTFSNLVVYKGHNSPVWDVDFGPFGFYFATASHDRTARIWSCDHINPLRIFAGHLSDVDVSLVQILLLFVRSRLTLRRPSNFIQMLNIW